ncbi:uncharacterized protein LOC111247640 [Varroa destructor]|uniref:Uncharacterized protein n=1 Tax=Varroa destructor TaxID=109461 RepID=A0A7M7JNN7_VARDE|nr:uncharacterized protein LOC111247640 [Varroa destructor]
MQYDPEMRSRSMYTVKDIFRCTMRSTVTTCFSFNCLEIMRPTYFRPPGSQCYTVDAIQWSDEDHRFKKCTMPWTWGLSYTVSVAQQTVKRLPSPFASKCTDYNALGKRPHFFGYLTQDLCIQECVMEAENVQCGCIRNTHEFAGFVPYKTCSVEDLVICEKQLANDTIPKCMEKCGPPCLETTYDVRLTSLGEDKKEKDRQSFSVSVKFSSDSQKIFQYQPKLSLIEAFGYMGGYIGMWLGLSLFSLTTDAESWLRKYLLERAKKRAKLVDRDGTLKVSKELLNSSQTSAKDSQKDIQVLSDRSATAASNKSRNLYSMSTTYGPVMIHEEYRPDARRFPANVIRRF